MRIFILIVALVAYPYASWGACDPETVQFYLDKGFTQEQITKLCSESSTSKPTYEPYQKPVVIYQEGGYKPGISAEERKAIQELKGGIDGRSIDVTDTSINYIRRVCIVAGNSPEESQRAKKCIDVAFSIARDGLRVLESGRGFIFFGQNEVKVASSSIKRKHVTADPWAAFSPDIRFALKRKFESTQEGNVTELPLRNSSSAGQIVSALRTIVAATELRQDSQYQSEVEKVLDDSYVPPTEEEYAVAQPKPEVIEEKKKKKRWWNPFD